MLIIIFKAFLLGGMLSLFIGPVFFMLIQASINEGYKGGFKVLLGLYLSDILYVVFTYFFFNYLLKIEIPETIIKIVGGVIFMIIGVFYLLKKKQKVEIKKTKEKHLILKSFIINSLNPSVFFFWFAVISWGKQSFSLQNYDIILYLILALMFAFIFDCLKIYFSIFLSKILKINGNLMFNKVIGIGIFIIGSILIFNNY